MTMNEQRYQVIIGVLVLIILVGGGYTFRGGGVGMNATSSSDGALSTLVNNAADTALSGKNSVNADENAQAATPTAIVDGEAVSVEDQVAGTEVAIASVSFSKPGWVAVRDAEGKTLGAAWFDAGIQKNAKVSLLRATSAGSRYQAMMYIDDGDKLFDLHKDTLVTNADGSVGGTLFNAK